MRCTIDYKKDFEKIKKLFGKFDKKSLFKISWYELINELNKSKFKNKKICFGTANLDQKYGFRKKNFKEEGKPILKYLKENNISMIDTARSYGNAEKFFRNKNFKVISKLSKISKNTQSGSIKSQTNLSIKQTYKNLGNKKLHSLLIHDWSTFIKHKREILNILLYEKKKIYRKHGASVYHPKKKHRLLKIISLTLFKFHLIF